ncbi:MAG: two-component sensor histidine kinase, partial [Dokdonella sp.]
MRERLQGYAMAYMAGSDPVRSGEVIPPEVGPDPRFDRPTRSGLYAGIAATRIRDGSAGQWRSPSARDRDLPFTTQLKPI